MSDRGLPIVDSAPACPFVAYEDDRDERGTSPDHRHRCYAEANPAPRALAHQEAYCLSSAFPVCPTFQDWARREAARARGQGARRDDDGGALAGSLGGADPDADQPQRNPPRNWAAPPPWNSRSGRSSSSDPRWEDDEEGEADEELVGQGRGLSGSYADRVASEGGGASASPASGGAAAAAAAAAAGAESAAALAASRQQPSEPPRPEPTYRAPGWEDDPDQDPPDPPRFRRRERDSARLAAQPAGGEGRGAPRHERPAPEWERAKPLEAYPTLRSRRLAELSVPPILVAVVAIALSAAVLFALPGLLGFGSPSAGGSPTPSLTVQTAVPSINPTPIPEPTDRIYVVKAGDTMSRIAGKFGLTLQQLIDANAENIPNPDTLQIGDQVIIPAQNPDDLPAASEIPGAT